MSNIENYNYWNDSRTIAGMVPKPVISEESNGNFILWEMEDVGELRLVCKWEVCGTCDGDGKHVNASIDCGGLTSEDFDRDPGFEEEYRAGNYDVTCTECDGRRVVPVLDESANPERFVKAYQKYQDDLYNDAAESAAERAMGA